MAAATDNIKAAIRGTNQKAVYWSMSELNEFGKPGWGTAIEIDCRWEEIHEQFINPNGETQVSRAVVFVDRDVEIKGVLFNGELSAVTDTNNPKNNDGAWEIVQFDKIPDVKGNRFLRKAYL